MPSWPDRYDKVFSRLESVTGDNGVRWSACCPGHDDRTRSLSLALGAGGKLLVKCHAPRECPIDLILSRIECTVRDLFPHDEGGKMATFLEAYQYRGRDGKVRYEVVRWQPKGFSVRRPNPAYKPSAGRSATNQPFLTGLGDRPELVLYKLPELLQAVKQIPKRWVLVLEGEKDVNTAERAGIVATCGAFGAGKWRPEYADDLKGVEAVVIPDEDPLDPALGYSPGLRHAQQVCRSLHGVAGSVRLLRLPDPRPKGDFTDWVRTLCPDRIDPAVVKKALAALISACPVWTPDTPEPAPLVFAAGETSEDEFEEGPEPKDLADVGEVKPADPAPTPEPAPAATPAPEKAAEKKPARKKSEKALEKEKLAAEAQKEAAPEEGPAAAPVADPAASPQRWDGSATADEEQILYRTRRLPIVTKPLQTIAEWWGVVRIEFGALARAVEQLSPDGRLSVPEIRRHVEMTVAAILRGLHEIAPLRRPAGLKGETLNDLSPADRDELGKMAEALQRMALDVVGVNKVD